MKKTIIIAAIMLAAIAPMKAQDFEKTADTTYARNTVVWPVLDSVRQYAAPIDIKNLIIEDNNKMSNAGVCFLGAFAFGLAGAAIYYGNTVEHGPKFFNGLAVALGVGSTALYIGGCCELIRKKVYLTPEGVIVRINNVEKKNPPKE